MQGTASGSHQSTPVQTSAGVPAASEMMDLEDEAARTLLDLAQSKSGGQQDISEGSLRAEPRRSATRSEHSSQSPTSSTVNERSHIPHAVADARAADVRAHPYGAHSQAKLPSMHQVPMPSNCAAAAFAPFSLSASATAAGVTSSGQRAVPGPVRRASWERHVHSDIAAGSSMDNGCGRSDSRSSLAPSSTSVLLRQAMSDPGLPAAEAAAHLRKLLAQASPQMVSTSSMPVTTGDSASFSHETQVKAADKRPESAVMAAKASLSAPQPPFDRGHRQPEGNTAQALQGAELDRKQLAALYKRAKERSLGEKEEDLNIARGTSGKLMPPPPAVPPPRVRRPVTQLTVREELFAKTRPSDVGVMVALLATLADRGRGEEVWASVVTTATSPRRAALYKLAVRLLMAGLRKDAFLPMLRAAPPPAPVQPDWASAAEHSSASILQALRQQGIARSSAIHKRPVTVAADASAAKRSRIDDASTGGTTNSAFTELAQLISRDPSARDVLRLAAAEAGSGGLHRSAGPGSELGSTVGGGNESGAGPARKGLPPLDGDVQRGQGQAATSGAPQPSTASAEAGDGRHGQRYSSSQGLPSAASLQELRAIMERATDSGSTSDVASILHGIARAQGRAALLPSGSRSTDVRHAAASDRATDPRWQEAPHSTGRQQPGSADHTARMPHAVPSVHGLKASLLAAAADGSLSTSWAASVAAAGLPARTPYTDASSREALPVAQGASSHQIMQLLDLVRATQLVKASQMHQQM